MEQSELFDVGKRTPSPGITCTPAAIGTGPNGETCRTCKHATKISYANTFYKCELARAGWTGGKATDIKLRWPACAKWEKEVE